ncbi:MAG TPA: DNA primase [Bryobacterales bacterium]|nr:DNA primase [Bryobacterales bacterium]
MNFAAQVKSSVDIVQVVGDYVRLRKRGTRYIGLCPFHSEKTPSFGVHPGLQIFKCFGCGKGGDVFNFLMEIEGMSFFEALKTLAEQHGIPMPKRGPEAMADEESKLRAALYQMHEIAQRLFRAQLESPEGKAAREYLQKRGLPPEAAEEFGLGFAPGGNRLARALEKEGFPPERLKASGLVIESEDRGGFFDRFRNRLMFPITSERGQLIAFAGRALEAEQQPKYLNSPESPIYKKSHVLYNLHRAKDPMRKRERCVLVEGYMDAIGVWRAGVKEVVASCGTALTNEQVRMIGRHAPTVAVNFDPDAAGRSAAERSINLFLEESLHVRVLTLPGGLDPDEFCKQRGGAAYETLLGGAPGYYFWLADRAREQFDTRTAEGRVAAFQSLMPAVNRVTNKIERVALVNDLADRLGVGPGLVLENFRKAAAERREPAAVAAGAAAPLSHAERLLLRLLLENEDARRQLLGDLESSGVIEESAAAGVFRALVAVRDSGEPFDIMALEARLEERSRRLLSDVLMGDTSELPDLEHGRAALRALEAGSRRARLKALHKQIQEAQTAGNVEEAIRLLRVKQELEKGAREVAARP